MRRQIAAAVLIGLISMVWLAPVFGGQAQPPPSPSSPIVSTPGTIQTAAPGAPTQQAVAVTTVPSPAAPQNPIEQIGWALAVSMLLRYLTNKKWFTFLTPESTAQVKAVWGFVAAFTTAAGIHLVVNGNPFSKAGVSVGLTGLSFDALKDVGWQWVSQQAWYEALVKKNVTA